MEEVTNIVVDQAENIAEILKQLWLSYGVFGIAAILFIWGAIKKIAKFVLFLIAVVGILALVNGVNLSSVMSSLGM